MGKPPGPTCVSKLGDDWIDGGTTCLTCCSPPVPAGTGPEAHSSGTNVEFGFIPVVEPENHNVTIEFEAKDLSIGTARYTGAKPVSKNLSMKPSVPGMPANPIAHANVEVHLYDDHGNEVPMTNRLVRHWLIRPMPGATVDSLGQWQILGLEKSEFSELSTLPSEEPAEKTFGWDRPGSRDSPGAQGKSVDDKPFGQLQEFLAGNPQVGGVYYQTYVLEDSNKIRIINTREMKLTAREFREVLKWIQSGTYSKTMARKLFFMLGGKTSDVTSYPKRTTPVPKRRSGP